MTDTKLISEVAAIIVRGLLAQGAPSIQQKTQTCVYLDQETGRRRAVGMLIPYDLYDSEIEYKSPLCLLAEGFLPGVPMEAEKLLFQMQLLHDDWACGNPEHIREHLSKLDAESPTWAADLTPEEKERFIEMVTQPPRL